MKWKIPAFLKSHMLNQILDLLNKIDKYDTNKFNGGGRAIK